MKNTILSAKDLCKSFAHNGGQLHILSHIDLKLFEGDFTVIMGASGSGKSTLLYALSGMDRATAGQVIYNNADLVTMSEKMNLSSVKSHLPSQVSGGQQQRCAIARVVINQPKLLFADEPTGALNRKISIDVLNLLTELNFSGQSILMVTHDIKAALRATRLLYLEDGKIIGNLTLPPYKPDEEKSRETQINAWLGSMEW